MGEVAYEGGEGFLGDWPLAVSKFSLCAPCPRGEFLVMSNFAIAGYRRKI